MEAQSLLSTASSSGGGFRQQLALLAGEAAPRAGLAADHRFGEVLAETIWHAPCRTLSGGTPEILRGIIARGLGLR
jgi:hypothetical protein